jgi:hypothetical protein
LRARRQGERPLISSPPRSGEAVDEEPDQGPARSRSPHGNIPAGRRACQSLAHVMPREPPGHAKRQATPPDQSRIIGGPIGHPIARLGDLVATLGIGLAGHGYLDHPNRPHSYEPPHIPWPTKTQPPGYACTCIQTRRSQCLCKLSVRAGLPGATIRALLLRAPGLDLCPGRLATTDAQ